MLDKNKHDKLVYELTINLIKIISETNGISIADTLELSSHSMLMRERPALLKLVTQFRSLLSDFQQDLIEIDTLLEHPVSDALFNFFKLFPIPYNEEHIHLTGSLTAEFLFPRLKKLLSSKNKKIYEKKIKEVYGESALPIKDAAHLDKLLRLKDSEGFHQYLKIILIPKLILNSKKAHKDAAYSMASELYHKYNVGRIRLKFTFSRESAKEADAIPGLKNLTSEDVVLGLYEGFAKFKEKHPKFDFVLSPSIRKESHFYDPKHFSNKKAFFLHQVKQILGLIDKYPFLRSKLTDIDTVGDEKDLYRKQHFEEMRLGFRKIQFKGLSIASHHGETWLTLKKGVQAVDNAMNIWHINTLEHGLSLGVNPNYYFHMLFEKIMEKNLEGVPLEKNESEYNELMDMNFETQSPIRDKLISGKKLKDDEILEFIKVKFHTAREVEHYQHDILNRMISKGVGLTALPSSNNKLTYCFNDYKDHPFSWWEKKGVKLGVGTDNYITLSTNFIREMLILLYTDPINLKITKLLMVVTGEQRRPYLSQLLWKMRELYK